MKVLLYTVFKELASAGVAASGCALREFVPSKLNSTA